MTETYRNQDPEKVLKEVWGYDSFRDNQAEAIQDIIEGNSDLLYLARTGAGKALHKDTLIPVYPKGFKRMGELLEGDTVFSREGNPTRVKQKFQPEVDKHYKLTFQNGEIVKACKDHLWVLEDGSVVKTEDLEVPARLVSKEFVKYQHKDSSNCLITKGQWFAKGTIPEVDIWNSRDQVMNLLEGILIELGSYVGGIYIIRSMNPYVTRVIGQILGILGISYRKVSLSDFDTAIIFLHPGILSKIYKQNLRQYLEYIAEEAEITPIGDTIVQMEEIKDNPRDYYCITVDDPTKTFLITESYIPTHNSLVFQLPSLIREGLTLVISPLLALQSDQVTAAKAKGIDACLLNSTLGLKQRRETLDGIQEGKYNLCYIAPESLMNMSVLDVLRGQVKTVVIDEAHCFPGDTRVITEDGAKSFYELEHMSVLPKVLSKNLNTGKTEYKQIKNVFRNPFQPLLKISLNERSNFLVSYNHVIFTKRGEVLAKDLTIDDKLISFQQKSFNRQLTSNQKSFVIGSILGDGGCGVSVLKDKMRLKFVHSEKQKDYLIWKHKFLGNTTGIKSYINQGYSDSRMYSFSSSMFPVDEVIEPVSHGTKRTYFPDWVYEGFDEKSLAIWLMDDGTCSKKEYYTIHCNSFSEEVTRKFISLISEKFAILAEFREYDGYSCISFNKESSAQLKNLIRPYVHPSMAYKLGEEGNPDFVDWIDRSIPLEEIGIQGIQKVSTTYEHLYDIEVEDNHNYFIHCKRGDMFDKTKEPVLVHNCVSQYGHDFRPDYQKAGTVIRATFPGVPIVALTATADEETKKDILSSLKLGSKLPLKVYVQDLDRANIHYHIYERVGNGYKQLLGILGDLPRDEKLIVYCSTKNACDDLSRFLNKQGYKSRPYYSTVSKKDKERYAKEFSAGEATIMCCTSSFGMGIDEEVRAVVVMALPTTLEDTVQYFGRAGRSGQKSHAYLLYDKKKDLQFQRWLVTNSISNPNRKKLILEKIKQVSDFAASDECYRVQILRYFGQQYHKESCGTCSNCIRKIKL